MLLQGASARKFSRHAQTAMHLELPGCSWPADRRDPEGPGSQAGFTAPTSPPGSRLPALHPHPHLHCPTPHPPQLCGPQGCGAGSGGGSHRLHPDRRRHQQGRGGRRRWCPAEAGRHQSGGARPRQGGRLLRHACSAALPGRRGSRRPPALALPCTAGQLWGPAGEPVWRGGGHLGNEGGGGRRVPPLILHCVKRV